MGSSAVLWAKYGNNVNESLKVVCVDTWLGSSEHYDRRDGTQFDIDCLKINDYGADFFDDFLGNIYSSGAEHSVIPFRSTSNSALVFFRVNDIKFDIVYIDADHGALSVMADLFGSSTVLAQEGIICFDDFTWTSVRIGIRLYKLGELFTHKRLSIWHRADGAAVSYVVNRTDHIELVHNLKRLGYRRWNVWNRFGKYSYLRDLKGMIQKSSQSGFRL